MFLRLRKCICGCSLQTGTILIGIICLMANLVNFFGSLTQLIKAHFHDEIEGIEMIACVFDIVAGVVLAVTSLLLAYSACNNKHRSLVMTWLIADMIITCVNIFFLVATFFVAAEPTRFNYVLAIIFDIVRTIIGFYLWIVVLSFYLNLRDDDSLVYRVTFTSSIDSSPGTVGTTI